jgi:phage shock protein A
MSTVIVGKPTSMSDVAERFETVVKEKRDLACRLSQALEEMNAISQLYRERRAEFIAEKTLLESEIEKLRAVVAEYSKNKEKRTAASAGVQSILEAREKLIREEFSRKFQDLAVEVKRQRTKFDEQVGKMKKKLSACICQPSDGETLRIVAAAPDRLVDYRKSGRL